MSTPGVVIDGKVVHAGGVPGRDKIERWLAAAIEVDRDHSMTDDAGAIARHPGRRRVLVVTVLGLAAAAGATGYVLTERARRRRGRGGRGSSDAVQRALRLGKPTVVEFGANACATCRDMKPVLEALRREHGRAHHGGRRRHPERRATTSRATGSS